MQLAGAVGVHEPLRVAGRLELGVLGVAVFATEGWIDLRVADQAIGHLRQGCASDLVGFLQAAVASLAQVFGVQVAADIAGRLEVIAVVDGGGDEGRGAAHLKMQRVAEFGQTRGGRGRNRDLAILVTREADALRGQEIVLHFGAGRGRGVALHAFEALAQMDAMGKGRGAAGSATRDGKKQETDQLVQLHTGEPGDGSRKCRCYFV